jgi:hypothetical protein
MQIELIGTVHFGQPPLPLNVMFEHWLFDNTQCSFKVTNSIKDYLDESYTFLRPFIQW